MKYRSVLEEKSQKVQDIFKGFMKHGNHRMIEKTLPIVNEIAYRVYIKENSSIILNLCDRFLDKKYELEDEEKKYVETNGLYDGSFILKKYNYQENVSTTQDLSIINIVDESIEFFKSIGYADSSIKKLIKEVDQNIEVCSCKELYEYLLDIIPKTSKYKKIAVNKINELYN